MNVLVPQAVQRFSLLANYFDLFERMFDPIFLIHAENFTIHDMNPAAERFLGCTVDQVCNRKILECVALESQEEFLRALRMSKRRYYPRACESIWLNASNIRVTMQVISGILKLNDGKEIFQLIAKDVTREKVAENKIQALLKELEAANIKLEALSITDEMTKVYNFRYFSGQLKNEHEKAVRYAFPYTLIFCDVDHFKHYNDKNGHPAGDQVLRGVAQLFKTILRSSDLVARYGGEEFVALCTNTSSEDGRMLAERVRMAIETYPFEHAKEQPLGCVSISIGVASFPKDGKTAEEILKVADQSAYLSKTNGRNRVTVFDKN